MFRTLYKYLNKALPLDKIIQQNIKKGDLVILEHTFCEFTKDYKSCTRFYEKLHGKVVKVEDCDRPSSDKKCIMATYIEKGKNVQIGVYTPSSEIRLATTLEIRNEFNPHDFQAHLEKYMRIIEFPNK